MEFIDRVEEEERLLSQLKSNQGRFVVIYGRRRLGKSTLIKKVLTDKDVYYMSENNEMIMQISLLQKSIAMVYPVFSEMEFNTWDNLLSTFNELCSPGCTLVLDEFPYLVKSCRSLPSTLQRFIDSKHLRFNLIICGSSQRMMQKLVLDASEPLYGRADERMRLSPIDLPHWKDAFHLTAVDAIKEYAVWGGVPRYWELRERESDFNSAIERLIFNPNGILYDEPASLFMEEGGNNQLYLSLMTGIGNGNSKFSELAKAVGKKTTELSAPLKNLMDMAFVTKEVPFGESEEKTKKTYYLINDQFMSFYYKFVAPNKSLIEMGRTDRIKSMLSLQFNDYVGHVWEQLSRRAVSGNNVLGHEWNIARRWWGNVRDERGKTEQIELDVVAESSDKKYLLVGECKWNKSDYSNRLLSELKRKASLLPFSKGKKIVYVLFLREKPINEENIPILYPEDVIELL